MNAEDKIEQEAALWVSRMDRGLSETEQDQFIDWLGKDPRHADEFTRHSKNWSHLDRLADWKPQNAPQPNRDLLAPHATSKVIPLEESSNKWIGSLSAIAAIITISGVVFWPKQESEQQKFQVPIVSIGNIEQRTLQDGSFVEINRGSALIVAFNDSERRIKMNRGEANFKVAKDKDKPFVVSAAGVQVIAVGTEFNVKTLPSQIEVIVSEGMVQVNQIDNSLTARVSAGEMVVVPLQSTDQPLEIIPLNPSEMQTALAWHPRLLDFSDVELQEVIDTFNQCNAPIFMCIEDSALAKLKVTATLRSDNVESFVRLMEGGFNLKATRNGNTIHFHQKHRS